LSIHAGLSPLVGIKLAEILLEAFRSTHKDVDVIYREGNLETLCDDLKREQLDLVIAPFDGRSIPPGDHMLQSVCREPLLFLPRGDDTMSWTSVTQVELKEIAEEHFVLVPNACGLAQVTKALFDEQDLHLQRYAGEASSYAAIQEWTQLGLGAGILPSSKLSAESRKRAIAITKDGAPLTITYFALGKPNTVPPALLNDLWAIFAAMENERPCLHLAELPA